jgi:hypothetical protein
LKYYNLSQPEFDALFAKQGGLCALCDQALIDGGSTHLNVDHDHETGVVRGLLCHRCNIIIGFLDKKELHTQFERIASYLVTKS